MSERESSSEYKDDQLVTPLCRSALNNGFYATYAVNVNGSDHILNLFDFVKYKVKFDTFTFYVYRVKYMYAVVRFKLANFE